MNLHGLINSKSDQKLIDANPLFFKNCLDSFRFLISNFCFERAKLTALGREYSVTFLKSGAEVQIVYELGVLPRVYIKDKDGNKVDLKKIAPEWVRCISRDNFPIHFQVKDVVNAKYASTKDYIKAISQAWDKNRDAGLIEIKACLKMQGTVLENKLQSGLVQI